MTDIVNRKLAFLPHCLIPLLRLHWSPSLFVSSKLATKNTCLLAISVRQSLTKDFLCCSNNLDLSHREDCLSTMPGATLLGIHYRRQNVCRQARTAAPKSSTQPVETVLFGSARLHLLILGISVSEIIEYLYLQKPSRIQSKG